MAPRRPATGTDALAPYHAKRDFAITAEPAGQGSGGTGHRFVVQRHFARREHWDFRLELDGTLKSWAVTRGPSARVSDRRLAVRTEDHPLDYARFEGTIPHGQYGGGTVMLWDAGTWAPHDPDPAAALQKGMLKFSLEGARMRGAWMLVRMRTHERAENWLLIKEHDAFEEPDDTLARRFDRSVTSGRDRAAIEAGAPALATEPARPAKIAALARTRPTETARGLPTFMPPALCDLQDTPPDGDDWAHEIKYDGYRIEVIVANGEARVLTREGLDWTSKFPTIVESARALGVRGAVIDGEAVVLDERGLAVFRALVDSLNGTRETIRFVAFDLLWLNGKDLRALPLKTRKSRLKALLAGASQGAISYADHIVGGGAEVFRRALEAGGEGIVSKRLDTSYQAGRTGAWIKCKGAKRDDFFVVGWAPSLKTRPFASLLLARAAGAHLDYVGRVGTGFTAAEQTGILNRLVGRRRAGPPAGLANVLNVPKGSTWTEPREVVDIEFAGWTGDGQLRQARFLATRPEGAGRPKPPTPAKAPKLKLDRLTHPDRVLIEDVGLTKRDLAAYLVAIAPRMMPHLAGRPVSFLRAPDGIAGERFFQRHLLKGMSAGLRTVDLGSSEHDYLVVEDAEGLVTCAQFAVLELHGWMATVEDIGHPDRIVVDLDPDEAVPFAAVKAAALQVRDILGAAGLKSFAMATGGKGIHIVAPLGRRDDWGAVEGFARGLALSLARLAPERFVATMSKERRHGKIFVDYLRNKRSATAILPYSPRARPGAPVAFPLTWKALGSLESANHFHAGDALRRRADPWPDFFTLTQGIAPAALAHMRLAGA